RSSTRRERARPWASVLLLVMAELYAFSTYSWQRRALVSAPTSAPPAPSGERVRHVSAVQLLILGQQVVLALDPIGIRHDTVGRTDELALRLVLGADALRAFHRVDDVHRTAGGNRLVRTHRLACIASGACVDDQKRHSVVSLPRISSCGSRQIARGRELIKPIGAPPSRPDGTGVNRVRMAAHDAFHVLDTSDVLFQRGDEAIVERQPAGAHHDALHRTDRLQ